MVDTGTKDEPRKLEFHYQKSPDYRTIHVDGALGGPTARRFLAITFYNERATIPRHTKREIIGEDDDTLTLGEETVEETLYGALRQLEVTAMLDINAARELLVWLRQQVGVMEHYLDIPEEERLGDPLTKDDS